MYTKTEYHDFHYSDCDDKHYAGAVLILDRFLSPGATVLDYGCGFGHFLRSISQAGYKGFGVEFDSEAANAAARISNCEVVSVADFSRRPDILQFDAIHLGDVLEHLPDPAQTLEYLLSCLKPSGLLFVEGPLEINPSPVYWASLLFGTLKHTLRPNFIGHGKPTHLFRTSGPQQLAFFHRCRPKLELLQWNIYETGWPYKGGGTLKSIIAALAILLGGKKFGSVTFGNRFTGIFKVNPK
jgi:SAM-dependent methyltransferase